MLIHEDIVMQMILTYCYTNKWNLEVITITNGLIKKAKLI
jgi:hypothetical protein